MVQLTSGNAVARFDSTDGYPEHPRQAAYHAAQVAQPGPNSIVVTTACQTTAPPSIAPVADVPETEAPEPEAPEAEAWWTKYSSCTKLKKNTVGDPRGPFRRDHPDEAEIYEWFAHGTGNRGDGDGDGLACE